MKTIRLVLATVMALFLVLVVAPSVYAAYNDEVFEALSYSSYTGAKDGTFSLTYLGRGCTYNGDKNDYRFKVNVYRSYPGSDWKFYSNNSRYQRLPTGRLFKGYQLNTVNPYVCIGAQEFSPLLHPFSYWTVSGVQQNVYTWRR